MVPILTAFGLLLLGYQLWLLPTLTDWVSSAVDEGYTNWAAQRIREGAWPHRDFFFVWTPGTPLLHALLQAVGLGWRGERACALFASLGSFALVLRFARDWGLTTFARALLALLLAVWSFSLWNIPYSSWYAVFLALLAVRALPRSIVISGLLFTLAFWFKQNVGILSCLGSVAWLLYCGDRRSALRLAAVLALGIALPFAGIALFGGARAFTQSFSQIFLFPLRYPSLMGKGIDPAEIAEPLIALGLWLLSLQLVGRAMPGRMGLLLQLSVLIFIGVRFSPSFVGGGFFLLSLAVWPLALLAAFAETDAQARARILGLWLPGAGIFFQVYPRLDFQHFLFVFPLVAVLLVLTLSRLGARYPRLPRAWVYLPALLLLAGGVWKQKAVVELRLAGQEDVLGRISTGAGARLNEEVAAVERFLHNEGLKEGDPILVLPNATAVYPWTGFRNPTPHPQFFPGYVEGYGDKQADVLPRFRAAGGKYLVVQERSGLETNVPEIWREIQNYYHVVRSFPEHFTIYAQ